MCVCVYFSFLLPVVKAQDYNFCILIYILKSFLFYDFLCNSKVNLILKNVHFAHYTTGGSSSPSVDSILMMLIYC